VLRSGLERVAVRHCGGDDDRGERDDAARGSDWAASADAALDRCTRRGDYRRADRDGECSDSADWSGFGRRHTYMFTNE